MVKRVDFQSLYPPRNARVHEVTGASAFSFACALSVQNAGDFIWIYKDARDVPRSFKLYYSMQLISIKDPKTQLWCFEEALRSGVVSLVVSVHDKAVGFTPMRRLQLAAELGKATGLMITQRNQTSPASETRWHCEPLYDAQDRFVKRAKQRWSLIKNKQGALGEWKVDWDEETHRITVV